MINGAELIKIFEEVIGFSKGVDVLDEEYLW